MKKYLLDFFKYNDWANKKVLEAIREVPEKEDALKLFSHLVNSLDKWKNRITNEVEDSLLNWYGQFFNMDEIESKWNKSIGWWIKLFEKTGDSELEKEIIFTRPNDGIKMAVKFRDLLLQLNYHSIHHRAQINSIISRQGIKPPSTDYILTVLKEVS
jgi:uncharacterized damage-inducible protein DinB